MRVNRKGRTDEIKRALAEAAERYRPVLDHDRDLVNVLFIVQFLPRTGEVKRTIVKPESHHEEGAPGGPEKSAPRSP